MTTNIILVTIFVLLVGFLYSKEHFITTTTAAATTTTAAATTTTAAATTTTAAVTTTTAAATTTTALLDDINNIAEDVLAEEEEEAAEAEAEAEEEAEDDVEEEEFPEIKEIQEPIMPLLNYDKTYNSFTDDKYAEVTFKETENKMVDRNEVIKPDIPELNEIKPFPCRTLEHTWDYMGVHNIEQTQDKCIGVNTAIQPQPIDVYFHPYAQSSSL